MEQEVSLVDVREILAEMVLEMGTYRAVGARLGLDHAYIYRVIAGKKLPGVKLLNALGLELVGMTFRAVQAGREGQG